MLIMINSKPTKNGRDQYTLQEIESGYVQTWTPPKGMNKKEITATIQALCYQMEKDIQLDPQIATPVMLPDFVPIITANDGDTLIADFCAYYLYARDPGIAENTYDTWDRTIRNHICPHIGHLTFNQLTLQHIDDLYQHLYLRKYKYATIEKVYTTLRGILKKAVQLGCLDDTFYGKLERPARPKDELNPGPPKACSPALAKYILRCADQIPVKWRLFINLLIDTGMRRGECEALQWTDIDFATGIIRVSKSVGYSKRKGVYAGPPKSRKVRTIDVSDNTMGILLLHYAHRESDTWLFPQRGNAETPMHPSTATAYLRKFSNRFGTGSISPHMLRHTFASIAITSGADIESVSEILGHSDASITLRVYTTSNDEAKRKANELRRKAILEAPDL